MRARLRNAFYEYGSHDPVIGTPFNRYMSKMSEMHSTAMLESYDFFRRGDNL
jgi:hypothetical protein